ncbi:Hypothetical predicted protein [Cloeon dipterum]|uniref:RRM domain-containing protein n=1 Tax=Cloeon dipterum TaxID=197152 RepID=A0A8S1C5L0_9INSE|nr:Hypothetical predicted protein [Cloeon dipterum]
MTSRHLRYLVGYRVSQLLMLIYQQKKVMVMAAPPSPYVVGREFVRQYYTLLNQAPMHLHRFYNENSSFVHGGLDTPNRETKPVIGQRQIHHRIQQLDFNDCHAKIRQVDSQSTLGNGVVVQVTGELSNNGEMMRRFTQTFVLAQQSPKKYYVHNDIFRYQDEMVNDEESDAGLKDEDASDTSSQGARTQGAPAIANFYQNTVISEEIEKPQRPKPKVEPVEEKQQQQQPETPVKEITEAVPAEQANKGPKTYATLVKSGNQVGSPYPNMMNAAAQVLPVVDVASYPPIQARPPSGQQQLQQSGKPAAKPQQSPPNQQSPPKPKGKPIEERKEPVEGEKRRLSGSGGFPPTATYPDSQQIFVGNVPISASEQDIKEIFSKYGTVVDLRLNSKAPAKGQPGKIFPKYGFVIFSDPAAVKLCLQSKPITMPLEPSHVLNIEEKRNKFRSDERPSGSFRGGMGRGGSMGPGGPLGMRRSNDGGGRGGRGGSRGGGGGGLGGLDAKGGFKNGGGGVNASPIFRFFQWMFRSMLAAQEKTVPQEEGKMVGEEQKQVNGLNLASVEKVSKLPVVEALSGAYEMVKGSSGVANWTLTTAEHTVASLGSLAATSLPQGPIGAVDRTLCSGLAVIEQKVPIIKEQPAEIYGQAMEKVGAVKSYGWNKANDMLSTKWGAIALGGFDTTADLINKYLDLYLPAQEGEPETPVSDVEVDKVSHSLQTMGQISNKVRSRTYRAVVQQMQGLKTQSESSINHVNDLLNLSEKQEEARRLAQNLSAFLASVPAKMEHLMPEKLVAQVKQAQGYAQKMYEGLMTCTLRDVTDSVREQAAKIKTVLQEVSTYTGQVVETFLVKSKEIADAQSAVVTSE